MVFVKKLFRTAAGRIFQNMSDFAEAAESDSGAKDHIMEDYLKSWGLDIYTPKFKEHGVDFETLLMLSEDNIKELVPMIGHRAKLIKQLSTVKNMLTDAFSSDKQSDCSLDCSTYTFVIDDYLWMTIWKRNYNKTILQKIWNSRNRIQNVNCTIS
ncbi:hypothetical protein ACJJTC_010031 [Scirpophaga incertulas]